MEDKTYALVMHTPLGNRRGSVTLHFSGPSLTGELTLLTRTSPICQGSRSGRHLQFQGEIPTVVGSVPYQASGTVTENTLQLQLTTPRGSYPIEGILNQREG